MYRTYAEGRDGNLSKERQTKFRVSNAICATIKIHECKREVTVRLLIYIVSVDPGRRSQRRTDGSFIEYSVANRRKLMTVFRFCDRILFGRIYN